MPRPSLPPCVHHRSIFDIDNIDIGPERRAYLETKLERVWEVNSQGSIPYVPYLRAPYYVWLGRPWQDGGKVGVHHEQKVEAPPLFPPTFLYTQSWEDPEPDMRVSVAGHMMCWAGLGGGLGAGGRLSAIWGKLFKEVVLHQCSMCLSYTRLHHVRVCLVIQGSLHAVAQASTREMHIPQGLP
jgi:hypothetical protein